MMFLQVSFWILIALLGIYLAFVILDIVFVLSFNKFFSKHLKAMIIFLNLKYDNIKQLITIAVENNVKVDNKLMLLIADIHREDFDNIEGNGCKKALDNLTYIKDEVLYLSRGNKLLLENAEFSLAKQNLLSLESQYRSTIASYNADVLGYNYWISFFPTRFIWKIFKFKQRTLLMN